MIPKLKIVSFGAAILAASLFATGCATAPVSTGGATSTSGSVSLLQKVEGWFSTEQANLNAWWTSPATQAGIASAESAIEAGLENFGINVAEQAVTSGGKINWTSAGLSAGATAARQLELSGDTTAAAITQNVMTVVQDPAQATAIAQQVVAAVATATQNGANPSGALEGAAQGLDNAAATVSAVTSK